MRKISLIFHSLLNSLVFIEYLSTHGIYQGFFKNSTFWYWWIRVLNNRLYRNPIIRFSYQFNLNSQNKSLKQLCRLFDWLCTTWRWFFFLLSSWITNVHDDLKLWWSSFRHVKLVHCLHLSRFAEILFSYIFIAYYSIIISFPLSLLVVTCGNN